ncbi:MULTISPECIES: helix-turn-helix domain-containing protein [unclassified Halomonas]|uniref:helix-turn-helix domain-containing protein n=1 Tax=unclassified Halomonas TaxID=2609666 RepID=UPI0028855954|nr:MULTISPECIES: helix-turn-helix domain-containing protein [unclassified Halomonas]MDT0502516.1 helix-turn-helix domain-containing protein [Halomonas sp. PAR7]MDT0512748.1 helix-turn-helix domain-containing protein [Halomonas sp. LES1]MDT0591934.1 helix-turn-helix domain-containing protein [Halomonas sp. PAR8]
MTKRIRSLARGLTVVNAIDQASGPVTLGELHHATGMDRATILRILATLEHEGWVYRGLGDNRYRLTYRLHDLGEHVSVHDAVAQLAAPVLEQLQEELIWPSDIAIFDGEGMAIIETSRRRTAIVLNREVVGYRPSMLKSAMGRAYLGFCDERRLGTILDKLKKKGGEEALLAADKGYIDRLRSVVQQRGYAQRDPTVFPLPSASEEEFDAIAVPVIVMGDVQACLSLVWINTAHPEKGVEVRFAARLREAAAVLAEAFHDQGLY